MHFQDCMLWMFLFQNNVYISGTVFVRCARNGCLNKTFLEMFFLRFLKNDQDKYFVLFINNVFKEKIPFVL